MTNNTYQNKMNTYQNEGLSYGDTEKNGAILWTWRELFCGRVGLEILIKNQLLKENCDDNKI
jgi:hypothetical protein